MQSKLRRSPNGAERGYASVSKIIMIHISAIKTINKILPRERDASGYSLLVICGSFGKAENMCFKQPERRK